MSKLPAVAFPLLFSLLTSAVPSFAVQPSAAAAKPAAAPFSYQTGVTTEADAKKYWRASGAKIRGSGFYRIDSRNSPLAKMPDARRKGEMFTVFDVDVDRASAANFYFYDGTLFRIEVPLKAAMPFSFMAPTAPTATFHHYNDEQISDIETALRKKYGPPTEVRQWLYARRSFDKDIPFWRQGDNTITLGKGEGMVVYENEQWQIYSDTYYRKLCRMADPKLNPSCQSLY